jgi:hypothetical protein
VSIQQANKLFLFPFKLASLTLMNVAIAVQYKLIAQPKHQTVCRRWRRRFARQFYVVLTQFV